MIFFSLNYGGSQHLAGLDYKCAILNNIFIIAIITIIDIVIIITIVVIIIIIFILIFIYFTPYLNYTTTSLDTILIASTYFSYFSFSTL